MIRRLANNIQKLLHSFGRLPRRRRWLVLALTIGVVLYVIGTRSVSAPPVAKSSPISPPTISPSDTPASPSPSDDQSSPPISQLTDSDPTAPRMDEGTLYNVVSVVDGDTIKVNIDGRVETVRFIGMDTPEVKDPRKPVQCFGKEASARMQALIAGKSVRLQADPSQGERDKYNRLLRYVYASDGTNLAYQMIREGYAHEYTYHTPYLYQTQFRSAQVFAQSNSLGLWSPSTCAGKP